MRDHFVAALGSPLALLLLQILVILACARACGWALRAIGQPRVVGDILAGVVLGPSVLQTISPESHQLLFDPGSIPRLESLGQLGLIIFMFMVGLELEPASLRGHGKRALFISQASILAPFAMGATLGLRLYRDYPMPGVTAGSFALFLGISMSLTAFPVLARILQTHDLARTELGALALACAAIDDATAWVGLAIVLCIVRSESMLGAATVGLSAITYILLFWGWLRPAWQEWMKRRPQAFARLSPSVFSAVLIFMILSSLITEMIGIHALLGAFVAGVALPNLPGFRVAIAERLRGVGTELLTPLYFAISGMRAQFGLLNDLDAWRAAGIILLTAVMGKLGAAALASYLSGMRGKQPWVIGALMNTRGLVELVVLNLGLDLGILSPRIFTILVFMAIVTTLMTSPLLGVLGWPNRETQLSEI